MDDWKVDVPVVLVSQDQADARTQCSICLEDLQLEEAVMKLSCCHLYHEPCITPWLDKHTVCPNCRRTVLSREDDDLYGVMTDEDFDELGELLNELNVLILAVESEDDSVLTEDLSEDLDYDETDLAGQDSSPLEDVEDLVEESECSHNRDNQQIEVTNSSDSDSDSENCSSRVNMLKRARHDSEDRESNSEDGISECVGSQDSKSENSVMHQEKRIKVRESPNFVRNHSCLEESSNSDEDEELKELEKMITELLDIMNDSETESEERNPNNHSDRENVLKHVTRCGEEEESNKEVVIRPREGDSAVADKQDGDVKSQLESGTVEEKRLHHENTQAVKERNGKLVNQEMDKEEEEEVECDMEYVKNVITEVWEIVSQDRLYSLN